MAHEILQNHRGEMGKNKFLKSVIIYCQADMLINGLMVSFVDKMDP